MKAFSLIGLAVTLGLLDQPIIAGPSQVIGWGFNPRGEATGVPSSPTNQMRSGVVSLPGEPLTNASAIAAGYEQASRFGATARSSAGAGTVSARRQVGQTAQIVL